MLRDSDVRGLREAINVLLRANSKSNNRYKLGDFLNYTYGTVAKMISEAATANTLQQYETQFGIQTLQYINKTYTDQDVYLKEITKVLAGCAILKDLIIEYRQIYQQFPVNPRRTLENLLRSPERAEDARRLFDNLKARRHK